MKTKKSQSSDKIVTESMLNKAMEDLSDTLTTRMEIGENKLDNVDGRLENVEVKLDDLNDKMMTGFDRVMKRLDDIDTNFTLLNGR